ncbi:Poly(ADP-ribose) glycohydrolase like protein, partial [Aduncisulcus paluster]
ADKKVGGFVLQAGAVQEETLLLAHTEAILAQIMTHILDDSDSVLIHGASFLAYNSGWKKTFRFRGIIQRDLCERISIPSETFFHNTSRLGRGVDKDSNCAIFHANPTTGVCSFDWYNTSAVISDLSSPLASFGIYKTCIAVSDAKRYDSACVKGQTEKSQIIREIQK